MQRLIAKFRYACSLAATSGFPWNPPGPDAGTTRTAYAGCRRDVSIRSTVADLGGHGWPANATADTLSFLNGQSR